jgi:hypothetical protein
LIGGTAGVLARFKANQKLGRAGVKTSPIAGSRNLRVELPESLSGYKSELVETPAIVIDTLPKDTSYGQRRYQAEDGFQTVVNVVLMGTDRTSLHKPQFCLDGAGWTIDQTEMTTVPIERPHHYELPVIKLQTTKQLVMEGQPVTARGIYVYWFVADGAVSGDPSGLKRMWSLAKHLARTGELQRWAYITYFAVCRPGQEEMTYNRMKELIAASVPEFQLVPAPVVGAPVSAVAAGKQLLLTE